MPARNTCAVNILCLAKFRSTSPDETAPRFLLRNRDQIYGEEFRLRVAGMNIEEVITAARSPWQNAFVERLIGSIRRECLDYVLVLGENHLRQVLKSYFSYHHHFRTHLSLAKDAPEPRDQAAARMRIGDRDR